MTLPDPLPLVPLQTVLFPGGLLPLKVFEARYLDLVGHCLRSGEPFGVVCMSRGAEAGDTPEGVRIERVGVLARIEDVDAEQAGILKVRCIGGSRFRLREAPAQQAQVGPLAGKARAQPAPDPGRGHPGGGIDAHPALIGQPHFAPGMGVLLEHFQVAAPLR